MYTPQHILVSHMKFSCMLSRNAIHKSQFNFHSPLKRYNALLLLLLYTFSYMIYARRYAFIIFKISFITISSKVKMNANNKALSLNYLNCRHLFKFLTRISEYSFKNYIDNIQRTCIGFWRLYAESEKVPRVRAENSLQM